ncbi:Cysteine desulfurase [Trichinella spiralis]|uniref:Cysteine desulfurase n=1 Tax=Trichinella spiralis TaxID=6334 RepID=A0ABR3K7N3_TRISP
MQRYRSALCGILQKNAVRFSGTTSDESSDLNRPNKALSEREIVRSRPLYLDAQATTQTDPRVLDAMIPYCLNLYGNPHSRTHKYGWESETAVETARERVARLIGADSREIVFTSGATEANNLAIKGVARHYKKRKNHIITTQIEHKCVLDSCRRMEREGFKVTYLPVQKNGLISLEFLLWRSIMKSVSFSQLKKLVKCVDRRACFFTLMLLRRGHKIYGPKGIGALYIGRKPKVRLEPQMSGGGQEKGFRSGTVPVPLVVGLGTACMICQKEMQFDIEHVTRLSKRLCSKLREALPCIVFNGDQEKRYPGCVNISFAYVEGESLMAGMKNIALSSGSACTSASLEPSYVLRAIGVDEDVAHSSIRFGIGRFTTEAEVDYAVERCVAEVKRLREMSPLWEMHQEGIDLKTVKWVKH